MPRPIPEVLYGQIIQYLNDGKTYNEIRGLTGCSNSQITNAKKWASERLKEAEKEYNDGIDVALRENNGVQTTTPQTTKDPIEVYAKKMDVASPELTEEEKDAILADLERDSIPPQPVQEYNGGGYRFLKLTASDIEKMLHYHVPKYIRAQLKELLGRF